MRLYLLKAAGNIITFSNLRKWRWFVERINCGWQSNLLGYVVDISKFSEHQQLIAVIWILSKWISAMNMHVNTARQSHGQITNQQELELVAPTKCNETSIIVHRAVLQSTDTHVWIFLILITFPLDFLSWSKVPHFDGAWNVSNQIFNPLCFLLQLNSTQNGLLYNEALPSIAPVASRYPEESKVTAVTSTPLPWGSVIW